MEVASPYYLSPSKNAAGSGSGSGSNGNNSKNVWLEAMHQCTAILRYRGSFDQQQQQQQNYGGNNNDKDNEYQQLRKLNLCLVYLNLLQEQLLLQCNNSNYLNNDNNDIDDFQLLDDIPSPTYIPIMSWYDFSTTFQDFPNIVENNTITPINNGNNVIVGPVFEQHVDYYARPTTQTITAMGDIMGMATTTTTTSSYYNTNMIITTSDEKKNNDHDDGGGDIPMLHLSSSSSSENENENDESGSTIMMMMNRRRLLIRVLTFQSDGFADKASKYIKNKQWAMGAQQYTFSLMKIHTALCLADSAVSKYLSTNTGTSSGGSQQSRREQANAIQLLQEDANIVEIAIESLTVARDRFYQLAQKQSRYLKRKLRPQWERRDEIKARMGDAWYNNPNPKYTFVSIREELEAELTDIQSALSYLESNIDIAVQEMGMLSKTLKQKLKHNNNKKGHHGSGGNAGSSSGGGGRGKGGWQRKAKNDTKKRNHQKRNNSRQGGRINH